MTKQTEEFIRKILPYAQEVQAKYGVPTSLVIAQAALESGWGTKVKGNNYFGIKADSRWNGEAINFTTHEATTDGKRYISNENFRAYDSLKQSVLNYGHFLANNKRYAKVLTASNGYDAADKVDAAGYATQGDYSVLLKKIIRSNNLTQYDDVKYQNYIDTDSRFEENRRHLDEGKKNDPKVWKDLMEAVGTLLGGIIQGISKIFGGDKNLDQNSIESQNVPNAMVTKSKVASVSVKS